MPDSAPLLPRDDRDICDAVAHAAASGEVMEIAGGGTKRGIGRPQRETLILSTLGLDRVIDYDPAELVLTVEPGARLADIEAMLAERNQMLAFEPFDFACVTGGELGRSTLGGVVCAGLSGSRRVSAGGARDHLLGFHAVNGRGEAFKAGGRVVKNVTGYDLSKLMTGSWGQLAVLTQITLKVLPRPEQSLTLALHGLEAAHAVAVMTQAMRAPADVAAASYASGVTTIRIEGFAHSVAARTGTLSRLLADHGKVNTLTGEDAAAHWTAVQTTSALPVAGCLWRIIAPPSRGADVIAAAEALGGRGLLDWAGGLAWLRMPENVRAADVRSLAEKVDGHATLIAAPEAYRATIAARHPEPPAVAALSERVKRSFDPAGIFDPLRFTAAP
jgi:glycolate oxidase FAD binding subunit